MNSWHSHEPDTDVTITEYSLHASYKVASAVKPEEEADRRYRILVLLQRSDRPQVWKFMCLHCGSKVLEIVNAEVEAVSDLVSMEDTNNTAVGTRCTGPYCRYWYYFKLGAS